MVVKLQPKNPNKPLPDDSQYLSSAGARLRYSARSHVWRPLTDVYETEKAIIVRVEIAGMREEDFAISLEERYLVIRGFRPDIVERRAYHQLEIPFGEFSTEVELSVPVVGEEIDASYQAGFLRLVLPKLPSTNVRVES